MTISPGNRLGPYEILAPLGAGGMGEVYRAKDPRLGRDVAIKVLPASFSQDADRLRRFEQEARAAGVLNHPNITAVYDIGTNAGDGAPYVVQELLEGETLRAAMAAGKLAPRKAIDYALQIAHGLAAAHEKGIIHRDLKPENLFVTNDGRVKILDFGLAKLTHTEAGPEATGLPTATGGTEPGVVLGTLGYMSPEQVKGKNADARSDIFSFGAILYEMLSGQRAFRGDSAAETMSAILREEPPDLSVTNQNVSPGLERIVRHAIEKNPEQRFHSAHDVAFALEALSGLSVPRLETSRVKTRGRSLSLAALAAVAVALAAGLLAGRVIWRRGPATIPSFKRLTYGRGPILSARFASDGHTIVYSASWDGAQDPQLYSVRAESPESLRLTLPPGRIDSISGNGEMLITNVLHRSVGYARTGTLSQAPMSGSASRDLLEDVGSAAWAPDGKTIAVVRAPEWHYRLEFPAGKVLYETAGWISYPRVSPGGDMVAFLDHPLFGDDRGNVAVIDSSGKKKVLSTGWESAQGVAWSPSGEEVWFTAAPAGNSRALYAVTLSGRQRPVAITPSGMMLQDISRDGRLLFVESNARLGFLGLLPGQAKERDLSGLEWSYLPVLSADGKTVAFSEQGEAGRPGYSVYLRKTDGSAPVRLGEGSALAISPDGKWVLTCVIRSTPSQIVLLPTGAGEPKTFPKDPIEHGSGEFGAFLPDGKRIVFNGQEPGHRMRAYIQDLAGGAAKPITPDGVVGSALSPDGAWLVTESPEGVALTPLGGGPSRTIPGLKPEDRAMRFASDGRSLFLRTTTRQFPAQVFRLDLSTGRREIWKELVPGDPAGITSLSPAAISEDGQTVLFGYGRYLAALYLAEGLR
jgi:serine/threonine protein kinase/Tol biopolymer transport system component